MVSAAEQLAANLNFGALAKADELKKRIWFTLGALLVYRLGTYIPLPGIDPAIWEQVFKSQAGGILGMFNMYAGGGIHRMAIFALNIMPYISASIIFQLSTTITLTGGTMFLMWLGEQITSRGIGNGISLIILAGIVAELPSALVGTLELGRQGALSTGIILAVSLMSIVVIAFIV